MRFRHLLIFLVLIVDVPLILHARTDHRKWCGTIGKERTEYLIRMHERHREALPSDLLQIKGLNVDVGEIAVVQGSPTTIISPNLFDLPGRKLQFKKNSQTEFNLLVRNGKVAATQGGTVSLGDDDSLKVDFSSGFSFPFYGMTYTSVFINSDGNLTFGKKDDASSPRDVFRTLGGPPRIAGFFSDLNPAVGGEVRVHQTSTRFRVTWKGVPEFGAANSNTFQINLFRSGKIQFVYGDLDANDAVVGISPGNTGTSNTNFLDYSETSRKNALNGAVIERFASKTDLDYVALINEFHQTHPDVFDLIVIFTDGPFLLGTGAFAFFSPIQNDIKGIGLPTFDFSDIFGSKEVEGFLMMGNITKYPADPKQEFLGTNNTLEVMGQEMGHRWLAFPRAVINGVISSELLGRDDAHWNFFMDSDASVMEGNDIQDNGNGTFMTVASTERYSKLDRYLMGLIPPSQVPPFFYVQTGTGGQGDAPEVGRTFSGTRVDVTVNDVIAAEGARQPPGGKGQKKFRLAFIFFADPNQGGPRAEDIAQVDKIRKQWKSFFRQATGKRGRVNTNLP